MRFVRGGKYASAGSNLSRGQFTELPQLHVAGDRIVREMALANPATRTIVASCRDPNLGGTACNAAADHQQPVAAKTPF